MSAQPIPASLPAWTAPANGLRRYHAMAKPIGSICNLDSTYCYSYACAGRVP